MSKPDTYPESAEKTTAEPAHKPVWNILASKSIRMKRSQVSYVMRRKVLEAENPWIPV